MTLTTAIPTVPTSLPPDQRRFLAALKVFADNYANTAVSQAGLAEAVTAAIAADGTGSSSTSTGTPTTGGGGSASTPAKLTGLFAIGSLSTVILTWNSIPYGFHSHTNIYRAAVDNRSLATKVGTSNHLVYADHVQSSSDYYYWIRAVSTDGVEGGFNAVDGTEANASLDPTYSLEVLENAITAAQIVAGAVTADRITAVTLAALSANMGILTAGQILSPDGTFNIDLANKRITITGPAGQSADDYMTIQNGYIQSWVYRGGSHHEANSLTHIETGVADSGDTVVIPGYFDTQPNIIVSPREIMTFDATYVAQDQTLKCIATNINEYATGQWEFDAVASLILAAAGGTESVAWTNGSTSSATFNSSADTQTTLDFCEEITVNIRVWSIRGNGSPATYYYRKATWKVMYREVGDGGAWSESTAVVTALGTSLGWVEASTVVTLSPAADWDFYVTVTYADVGGTFVSGSPPTAEDVKNGTNAYEELDSDVDGVLGSASATVEGTLPAYSPPAGWVVTSVLYEYDTDSYLWANVPGIYIIKAEAKSRLKAKLMQEGTGGPYEDGTDGATDLTSMSHTTGSYATDEVSGEITVQATIGSGQAIAQGRFSNITATITRQQNASTTADNDLNVVDYQYELSGSSAAATGTLNWTVIGR